MKETKGNKAIGKIAMEVTDELGALARTISRLWELRDICERQIFSIQQADNWFAILDTVLESDLGILDSVGKGIAKAVPGAVYNPPEI